MRILFSILQLASLVSISAACNSLEYVEGSDELLTGYKLVYLDEYLYESDSSNASYSHYEYYYQGRLVRDPFIQYTSSKQNNRHIQYSIDSTVGEQNKLHGFVTFQNKKKGYYIERRLYDNGYIVGIAYLQSNGDTLTVFDYKNQYQGIEHSYFYTSLHSEYTRNGFYAVPTVNRWRLNWKVIEPE